MGRPPKFRLSVQISDELREPAADLRLVLASVGALALGPAKMVTHGALVHVQKPRDLPRAHPTPAKRSDGADLVLRQSSHELAPLQSSLAEGYRLRKGVLLERVRESWCPLRRRVTCPCTGHRRTDRAQGVVHAPQEVSRTTVEPVQSRPGAAGILPWTLHDAAPNP